MKTLGLIPTRGGSKGLPSKNIRLLNGQPLIAYTIKTALSCPEISDVLVATDDDATAEIATKYGAQVYRYPTELSVDGAATFQTIRYVVDALMKEGRTYAVVATMRATTPLRSREDIQNTLNMLEKTGADSVVSMVADETGHPIRLKYLGADGHITPLEKGEEDAPLPRQKLPVVYKRNGAVYATKTEVILNGSLFGRDSRGYVMPKRRSVNINDEDDFIIAEALDRYFREKL